MRAKSGKLQSFIIKSQRDAPTPGTAAVNRACKEQRFSQMLALMDGAPFVPLSHACAAHIVDTDARARRQRRSVTTKLCFQVIGKGDNDRDQFVFRVKRLRDTTLLQL